VPGLYSCRALLNEPLTQPACHSARISRPAQQPRRTIAPHPADEVRRVLARQLGLDRPCRIERQYVDKWRRRSLWIAQRGELCPEEALLHITGDANGVCAHIRAGAGLPGLSGPQVSKLSLVSLGLPSLPVLPGSPGSP
jgi:hypothetical protein